MLLKFILGEAGEAQVYVGHGFEVSQQPAQQILVPTAGYAVQGQV